MGFLLSLSPGNIHTLGDVDRARKAKAKTEKTNDKRRNTTFFAYRPPKSRIKTTIFEYYTGEGIVVLSRAMILPITVLKDKFGRNSSFWINSNAIYQACPWFLPC